MESGHVLELQISLRRRYIETTGHLMPAMQPLELSRGCCADNIRRQVTRADGEEQNAKPVGAAEAAMSERV